MINAAMVSVHPKCLFLCTIAFASNCAAPLDPIPNTSETSALSVQDEVLANIRRQPVGNHTIDDFNLPEDFLRRMADRIICTSFEDRFRIVVADNAADISPARAAPYSPAPKKDGAIAGEELRIIELNVPKLQQYRQALPEARPPLRGFRPPLAGEGVLWPFELPSVEAPRELRDAAAHVGQHLARDGLLKTLVRVIQILGSHRFIDSDGKSMHLLRTVGFPEDLLKHFSQPTRDEFEIVRQVAQALIDGNTTEAIASALQSEFGFHKTCERFIVATESGEDEIDVVRLQLTRGSYWEGPGDGGNLDMARQLIERLPDASFIASIERRHLNEFAALAHGWPLTRPAQLTIIPEDFPVAQWAQDNGKPGFIQTSEDDPPQPATIVPRYASRGEDGSTFVPGETFLLDGLSAAGQRIIHSPLLFQGGNLLAVRNPANGQRILLIGEAEVYRNTALGLTVPQVMDAFRIEFSVDRCEVIPTVSFHIDYDVSLRAQNGKLLAFVNDPNAAAKVILECGLNALETHTLIEPKAVSEARGHLNADRWREFLNLIVPIIDAHSQGNGRYPRWLADRFSAGGRDSGVGNFQRFLLAMDIVRGVVNPPLKMPVEHPLHSYLGALSRQELERQKLHERLAALGFEVIPIPSLSDAGRSITYINGIHDRTRYIMPTYGGLYAPLDVAATKTFQRALGDHVLIVPIQCSESQRRTGALHCSCSVHPKR